MRKVFFKSGNSGQTRSTPGSPEIDQQHLARRIGSELLQIVGRSHLQFHRLGLRLFKLIQLTVDLRLPLGRTAKRRSMRDLHSLARQQRLQRVPRILRFNKRRPLTVIDAPFVAKLPVFIENEDMRRRLRPVQHATTACVSPSSAGKGSRSDDTSGANLSMSSNESLDVRIA